MNNNIRSWRSPAVIVFMLVLAVIIAGCGNVMPSGPVVPDPNGGKNGNGEGVDPTPTDPDPGDKDPTPSEPDPGDDDPLPDPADLAKGDGAPAPLDGRVHGDRYDSHLCVADGLRARRSGSPAGLVKQENDSRELSKRCLWRSVALRPCPCS